MDEDSGRAPRVRTLILGAGGRDFHVFNTCYRDDPNVEVVAFTATQIPHIGDRRYPPVLAGALYPAGIAIHPEEDLEALVQEHRVERAVLAYSDVSLEEVERTRQRVEALGARFSTFDPDRCLLLGTKPCLAVCAVRTGCGKSQVSRHVAAILRQLGARVVVIRHPMPYGQLERQVVQRFAELADLDRHDCTIEEREEYEPHIAAGSVVYAGADYAKILVAAEHEADIVIWDGGNNDTPFVRPDLLVTLLDPLRAGDELRYFPSRWNLERADVLLIAKSEEASAEALATLRANARTYNERAALVHGRSPIQLDDEAAVRGKRVLVVEDGPTTTHGGMGYGAGWLAAKRAGATIVDPRPWAEGEIAETFAKFPHLHDVLPALGYGSGQLADLAATIDRVACDAVVVGTPIDIGRVIQVTKPMVRARYAYADAGEPTLGALVRSWWRDRAGGGAGGVTGA
jgi:predicted GTPase